jgi:hypothetical protein
MCTQQTYTCLLCLHTRTLPPTLCPNADLHGLVCKPPYKKEIIEATCSNECREKENEVREWGRRRRERREKERRERYGMDEQGWKGGERVAGWREI